jgi:hypothetical protein
MSKTNTESCAKQFSSRELICSTWFERDRQHVRLEAPNGRVVFELWDDAVTDAIDSGYLSTPRRPRPSDDDWHQPAVDYAISLGMLSEDGSLIDATATAH